MWIWCEEHRMICYKQAGVHVAPPDEEQDWASRSVVEDRDEEGSQSQL
jgi:hypothetical protein